MSRPRSTRSSTYSGGLRGINEYDAAAAYGEPALSDASSDEQIARAISESKRTAHLEAQRRSPTVSRTFSYASSFTSTLLGSDSGSSSPRSEYARSPAPSQAQYGVPPIPTPRYAADEVIARNLARSWRVASVQSDLIADPQYARPAAPPLVPAHGVPVPESSTITSSSSHAPTFLQWHFIPPHTLCTIHGLCFLRPIGGICLVRTLCLFSGLRSLCLVRVHNPVDLLQSHGPRSARVASAVSGTIIVIGVRQVIDTQRALAIKLRITMDERQALAQLHALATSPIRCTNPACGALIPPAALDNILFPTIFNADASPPRGLFAALHARCPACSQSHCRGCGLPTGCDVGCCGDAWRGPGTSTALVHVPRSNASSGSASPRNTYNALYPPPPCPVPIHCSAVRALGALGALIAFDRAHIAMGALGHGRAADKPLIGQLHALVFFLSPPAHASSPQTSGLLLLSDGDEEGPPQADAALPALLGLSRVPAYAASLLRAGAAGPRGEVDVGAWMARAPAYGAVLRVLRALGDAGCQAVLARPVRAGAGTEAWFRRGAPGGDAVWTDDGGGEPLRVLVRRLESARVALLRLAGATTFGPTVEKAHALCDGVLYLLLQDVLGEDEGG
ncbi:hypothetical protein FB451DRAFT_1461906 [Mycena latifolia]|nr:hypothetical protein FB451DRAFT_1461906 [Mycena latifolia]